MNLQIIKVLLLDDIYHSHWFGQIFIHYNQQHQPIHN